jgi:sterol desaturase/sphingolipid hydroxylase (fatty acid hydroxylase superfamily)
MPASIEKHFLTSVVLSVLAVCLTMEALFPHLRPKRRTLKNSYRTNACTFLFNNITLPLLSVSSLYYVAQSYSHVGLLSRVDDNFFKWCISLVLFDLAFYWWHYANHKFSFLWMFHKVHHSDRTLNVSTGIRFHVGELLLTVLFKSAFIVVIGVQAHVVVINEAILTLFVLFHHTNVAFRGETWLSRVLIVPKLHRLHHSARRDEHDSNYGCVFSLWDRAFGTIKEAVPADIGLMSVNEQSFIELLKFGFMITGPGFRRSNSRPASHVERMRRRGACDRREWASAGGSQAGVGARLGLWLRPESVLTQVGNVFRNVRSSTGQKRRVRQ